MSVLVFGTTGQLAREIARRGGPSIAGHPVMALGRAEADLQDAEGIAAAIRRHRPVTVINAAAYTAVDRAESEPGTAFAVNRDAPAAMADACRESGAVLIHVSTDYVFNGAGEGAHTEDDPISPLSVYGRSKAEGEEAIRARLPRHLILRTSWVFSAHGQNFVKTMLRLGRERDGIGVVDDQWGGPTPAAALADAVIALAASASGKSDRFGTFHFQGAPVVSWRAFAEAVFAEAGDRLPHPVRVRPIATAQYPTPAARPANSALDCERLRRCFGIVQPDWREGLRDVLDELLGPCQGEKGTA